MKGSVIVLAALLFTTSLANANDSIVRVGAGGLELLKTDKVQMLSETLEISRTLIRVTYRFLNDTSNDLKETVAFPMPEFSGIPPSGRNERPLDTFKMFADGQPVRIKKRQEFLIDHVDVSPSLRSIGLTDEQIFDTRFSCMVVDDPDFENWDACKLTAQQMEQLKKLHVGQGHIKETAYWDQLFPAHKIVEVVHEYKPFNGWALYGIDPGEIKSRTAEEACLDNGAIQAITKKVKQSSAGVEVSDVEYILGTGRNWHGPIKNFKLVIRKEFPDDIVSLCFPGKPVKTSPTTIEFSQFDYVPQDKLVVYFYYFSGRENANYNFMNQ